MGLIRLAIKFSLENKARSAMSVVAVLIGVASIITINILGDSKGHERELPSASISPGNILVDTHETVTLSDLEKLKRSPAIKDMSTEIRPYTYVIDNTARNPVIPSGDGFVDYVGTDLRSPFVRQGYPLIKGRYPRLAREVVISGKFADNQKLEINKTISLPTPKGVIDHKVVGILDDYDVKNPMAHPLVLIPAKTVEGDFSKKTFHTIHIDAAKGKEALAIESIKKTLGETVSAKIKQKKAIIKKVKAGNARYFIGSGVLFVSCLLIYNSFSISVTRRRRQLGILRAVGMKSRHIKLCVLLESLVVGIAGTILGLITGMSLSWVVTLGQKTVDPTIGVYTVSPVLVALCVLIGLIMTIFSSWPAARLAARAKPLDAMYPERFDDHSWFKRYGYLVGLFFILLGLFGIFFFGLTGDSTPLSIPAGMLGIVFFLLGTVFFMPKLIPPLVKFSTVLLSKGSSQFMRLAIFSAAKNPSRTAITVSSFFIAVAVSLGYVSIDSSIIKGMSMLSGNVNENEIRILHTLDPKIKERLSSVPEIETFATVMKMELRFKDFEFSRINGIESFPPDVQTQALPPQIFLNAIDPDKFSKVMTFIGEDGSKHKTPKLPDNGMLITKDMAERYGMNPGETYEFVHIDSSEDVNVLKTFFSNERQSVKIKIVGIIDRVAGLDGGFVSEAAIKKLVGKINDSDLTYVIKPSEGQSLEAVARKVDALFAEYPETRVHTKERLERQQYRAAIDPLIYSMIGMVGLTMLLGIMSVINTQSANIVERQKELGLLRAVGLTSNKLRRMLIIESSYLGILGSVPGVLASILFSATFIFGFKRQVSENSSFIVPFNYPYIYALAFILAAAVGGMAAGYIAARKITEASIIDSLRYE